MKRIKPSVSAKTSDAARSGTSANRGSSGRTVNEEQVSALPLQFVLPLIREMDESAKRKIAQALQFPFARRAARKWPEALFAKSMLDLIAYARSSRELRGELASALLPELDRILSAEEPAFDLQNFDKDPDSWIKKHGKWHIYWALYFYAAPQGEERDADADRQRLERVAASEASASSFSQAVDADAEPSLHPSDSRSEAAEQRRIEKLNRRIETLEQRFRKEEDRARQSEKEASEARRAADRLEEQVRRLESALEDERRHNGRLVDERDAASGKLAELKRQHKQERSRFEAELAKAGRGVQAAIRESDAAATGEEPENGTADHRDAPYADADRRYEERKTENGRDPSTEEPEELLRRLDELVRRDLREAGAALPGESGPGDLEARTHLRRALELLDAVDAYAVGRRLFRGDTAVLPNAPEASGAYGQNEIGEPRPDTDKARGSHADRPLSKSADVGEEALRPERTHHEPSDMADVLERFETADADDSNATGQSGTFHRRDHGGYIVLENGETFNITESMVYKHRLQHEAEVRCMPREDGQGGTQYEIELLFQGDDTFSPVRQYNGYVELGEHDVWYAVDMNDADRRYPIHAKDLDIQRPADGSPCIFNVGEEESVARLARVYRDFSDPDAAVRAHSNGSRPSSSSSSRPKREGRKSKPEPYLEGCIIVVLGGQRKWFEDVVVESGAVYVHENGERPDLVSSDLRRAQALFLLITSTSHRASWEGIELAKASGVPYFIIQGSKSNLRSMLWENREEIMQANRGDNRV